MSVYRICEECGAALDPGERCDCRPAVPLKLTQPGSAQGGTYPKHRRLVNANLSGSSMDENSVDLIVTSIPFSNHYEYTPSYNDFGHNEDTDRFFEQMDYLTPNLLRVLKPGRNFCCHVKDRVLFGNATGTGRPTIEPFHALCMKESDAVLRGLKLYAEMATRKPGGAFATVYVLVNYDTTIPPRVPGRGGRQRLGGV